MPTWLDFSASDLRILQIKTNLETGILKISFISILLRPGIACILSSIRNIPRLHREEKYCYLAELETKLRLRIQPPGKMLQFKFGMLQADPIRAISLRRHLSCLPNFSKWIFNDSIANQVDVLHTCSLGHSWNSNFESSRLPVYGLCCHHSQASFKLGLQWRFHQQLSGGICEPFSTLANNNQSRTLFHIISSGPQPSYPYKLSARTAIKFSTRRKPQHAKRRQVSGKPFTIKPLLQARRNNSPSSLAPFNFLWEWSTTSFTVPLDRDSMTATRKLVRPSNPYYPWVDSRDPTTSWTHRQPILTTPPTVMPPPSVTYEEDIKKATEESQLQHQLEDGAGDQNVADPVCDNMVTHNRARHSLISGIFVTVSMQSTSMNRPGSMSVYSKSRMHAAAPSTQNQLCLEAYVHLDLPNKSHTPAPSTSSITYFEAQGRLTAMESCQKSSESPTHILAAVPRMLLTSLEVDALPILPDESLTLQATAPIKFHHF